MAAPPSRGLLMGSKASLSSCYLTVDGVAVCDGVEPSRSLLIGFLLVGLLFSVGHQLNNLALQVSKLAADGIGRVRLSLLSISGNAVSVVWRFLLFFVIAFLFRGLFGGFLFSCLKLCS